MKKRKKKSVSGQKHNSKYMFILFFLAVLTIAVLIVRPFLSTIIVSAILVYVLYPVYKYFCKMTKMNRFSAVVLILLIVMLASIPLIVITGTLTTESYTLYSKAKGAFLDNNSLSAICPDSDGFICGSYHVFSALSEKYNLNFHLAQGFSSLALSFGSKLSEFILNVPGFLLQLFISLFAMYYMFIDGESMLAALKRALPLSEEHSTRMLGHFNDIIHATIYGAIVIAIVQGVVAGIGYYIFGLTSPFLLAILTILAAFIPFFGAALVWLPAGMSLFINGLVISDQSLMLKAGGLLLWGSMVSVMDNFLRPKIVGDRAKIHPLVILLGVFGGLALFGFVGIMIGPLLLTLFIAALEIYEQEKEYIQ